MGGRDLIPVTAPCPPFPRTDTSSSLHVGWKSQSLAVVVLLINSAQLQTLLGHTIIVILTYLTVPVYRRLDSTDVPGTTPSRSLLRNNLRHTFVPLSPSSISWYRCGLSVSSVSA